MTFESKPYTPNAVENMGKTYYVVQKHPKASRVLWCDDSGATVLGAMTCNKKPGLAVKKQDGWTSIYCGAYTVPSILLRQIGKFAGVHIYDDTDDVVYARKSLLVVHTAEGGKRTLHLPREVDVLDTFSGEVIARKTRTIEATLPSRSTTIYLLKD